MKATLDIPKRRGSTVCTRNGAILEAARSNCLDWKIAGGNTLAGLGARRDLRNLLALVVADLQGNPHASFADHQARGTFGWMAISEHSGYWRIEAEVSREHLTTPTS